MSTAAPSGLPNRRRRVRHKILTPAYASFAAGSKGLMLDLNEIIDISEDGIAIQCTSPVETKRRFDLCLDLAESMGQIYTTGDLVWSNPSGRCGFRFSNLPPASLTRLREWLLLNALAGAANAEAGLRIPPHAMADAAPLPSYTDTLAAVTAVQREAETLGADLVAALHLVASRALTLVRASGAAIALAAEDPKFMICRASAGPDAPPVGARLQVGSGFSGEAVRTGRVLRCDDTETDPRVDRESCRALGIGSILAAPVHAREKVIGLLEVFSPQHGVFTEDDGNVLRRLAETIVAAVTRTARSESLADTAPRPAPRAAAPGSILFASASPAETKHKRNVEEPQAGIRLPRSYLILLVCAAATIAMVLGFLFASWRQEKSQTSGRVETVLASSQPPNLSNPAVAALLNPASPNREVETATFEQLHVMAERGNPAAENALGLRYAQGDAKEGVRPNEAEAARWFTKAAENGNVPAQSKLGSLYWDGRGVPPSLNQAYFWTVLARAGGSEGSKALATVLASHMSRAQAASIEQEAERWFQQHQVSAKPAAGR